MTLTLIERYILYLVYIFTYLKNELKLLFFPICLSLSLCTSSSSSSSSSGMEYFKSPYSIALDYREYLKCVEIHEAAKIAFDNHPTQKEIKKTIAKKERAKRKGQWEEFALHRERVKEIKKSRLWQDVIQGKWCISP